MAESSTLFLVSEESLLHLILIILLIYIILIELMNLCLFLV